MCHMLRHFMAQHLTEPKLFPAAFLFLPHQTILPPQANSRLTRRQMIG